MDVVDHQSMEPVWRQLARILRDAIASGEIPLGSPIPSKRTLQQAHDVSTTTIDAATAALRGEGLIAPVKGKGLYAIKRPDAADAGKG